MLRKTKVFNVIFLENSENVLNFTKKNSKKFQDFKVFFFSFLYSLEHSRKIKEIQNHIKILENSIKSYEKFQNVEQLVEQMFK